MWHALVVTMLAGLLCAAPCHAQSSTPMRPLVSQAPIGGDSAYTLALGGPMGPSWSGANELWYKQNRRIAIVGKVLTVLGISLVVSQLRGQHPNVLLAGLGTQYLGQLIWGAAELRGANELHRRGFRVRNTAAIVALCGALLLSPLTWIAGPIQSAQIREAHTSLALAQRTSPSFSAYGLGFRGVF